MSQKQDVHGGMDALPCEMTANNRLGTSKNAHAIRGLTKIVFLLHAYCIFAQIPSHGCSFPFGAQRARNSFTNCNILIGVWFVNPFLKISQFFFRTSHVFPVSQVLLPGVEHKCSIYRAAAYVGSSKYFSCSSLIYPSFPNCIGARQIHLPQRYAGVYHLSYSFRLIVLPWTITAGTP